MRTSGSTTRWVFTIGFLLFVQSANADVEEEIIAEKQECMRQMSGRSPPELNGTYCPQEWDGAFCWPYGSPGERVSVSCPKLFPGRGHAFRLCDDSGKWVTNRTTNRTFLNFTGCMEVSKPAIATHVLDKMAKIYTVGYSISLGSLFVAFIILACFKRLHCTRNYVHMHLFMSYMLRAVFILLRDALLYPSDVTSATRNTVGCKLLNTCSMYTVATNYYWILVEGLYLHNLIFVSVFSERKFFYGFIAVGWVFPLTFVIPWAAVRATLEDTGCWDTDTKPYKWIYKAPIVLSIVVNFLLFLNILRVLVKKLQMPASVTNENSKKCCGCCFHRQPENDSGEGSRYRSRRGSTQLQMPMKLAKSTLVLIPLFGVHYIVFVGMPDDTEGLAHEIRLYFEVFFNSFQGFFVAILYCFLNGEVRTEFTRRWEHWKLDRNLNNRGNVNRSKFSFTAATSLDYSLSFNTNSNRNGTPPSTSNLPRNGKLQDRYLLVADIAPQRRVSFSDESPQIEDQDICLDEIVLVKDQDIRLDEIVFVKGTAPEMESSV